MQTRRDFIAMAAAAAGVVAVGSPRAWAAPKRILILGGTGFVGPHQVRRAVERGHQVTIFNRGRSAPGMFGKGVEELAGDRKDTLDWFRMLPENRQASVLGAVEREVKTIAAWKEHKPGAEPQSRAVTFGASRGHHDQRRGKGTNIQVRALVRVTTLRGVDSAGKRGSPNRAEPVR
jgi:hypothetical protein